MPFTDTETAEILNSVEFMQEAAFETAKVHAWAAECAHAQGTSAHIERPAVRTVEQMLDAAAEKRTARKAFFEGPRGRFLQAIRGIRELPTYEPQAWTLQGIYDRSLSDDRLPLDIKAVGAALAVLNGVPGSAAREAIDALSELLIQDERRVA